LSHNHSREREYGPTYSRRVRDGVGNIDISFVPLSPARLTSKGKPGSTHWATPCSSETFEAAGALSQQQTHCEEQPTEERGAFDYFDAAAPARLERRCNFPSRIGRPSSVAGSLESTKRSETSQSVSAVCQ
jgi:hypothetical protein